MPKTRTTKRMGGRGCPECGSHNTEGLGRVGSAVWCNTCGYKWFPCTPGCRGYRFDMHHPDGPCAIGCLECGVPNRIARMWPEVHRALASRLDGNKLGAVDEQPPQSNVTRSATDGQSET